MNFTILISKLLVGSWPCDADDFELLKVQGVTAILSLQSEGDQEDRTPGWEEASSRAAGLTFRNIAVTDYDAVDLESRLRVCVQALDELLSAGHTVFLHCTAGVYRSPTVAVAYMHWNRHWPLDRALEFVKQERECCPDASVIRRASVRRGESK